MSPLSVGMEGQIGDYRLRRGPAGATFDDGLPSSRDLVTSIVRRSSAHVDGRRRQKAKRKQNASPPGHPTQVNLPTVQRSMQRCVS